MMRLRQEGFDQEVAKRIMKPLTSRFLDTVQTITKRDSCGDAVELLSLALDKASSPRVRGRGREACNE